jgi:hemerythrin-like domain-containing protein
MGPIDVLEEQHREVEALFDAFDEVEDASDKRKLFLDLADAIAAHSTIEERHFYPAIRASQTEDLVREAFSEHLQVKKLVADLLDTSAGDPGFVTKVHQLKENISRHVAVEEGQLFPLVRRLFADMELDVVADQMEQTYAELMLEGEPRENVPRELNARL